METITIKVGKVPGTITEVAVNKGTTVEEVLGLAGITDVAGYEVRANGNNANLETVLNADSSVLLMKQIKGNNTIMVKVGKVPGTIQEVAVNHGASVSDVLNLVGISDAGGYEVRVGGNNANVGTVLTSDTSVLLMKQIKGNK